MSDYRYFTPEQDKVVFKCPATGEDAPESYLEFMHDVDKLRHECGFAFIATSGYRSAENPLEAKKDKPGMHHYGAIDISITNSAHRHTLLFWALKLGFTGIGLGDDFIHVDKRTTTPVCWHY